MAILLMMLHGTLVFRDTRFMTDIVHIREKIPAPKILGELWALKVILRQCKVAQKQKPCSATAKKKLNCCFGDILILQLWPWNQAEVLKENNMVEGWEDFVDLYLFELFIAQNLPLKQSNIPWNNGPCTLISASSNLWFREQNQHLKGYFVTVALIELKKINMKEVRDAAC